MRNEVGKLLDIYLPDAIGGVVGVKYVNPILNTYENGNKEYDKTKASGVQIILEFKFGNVVAIPQS